MQRPSFSILALLLGVFFISGCTTTPIATAENNKELAAARHFLHNVGIGDLAMNFFLRTQEQIANEQPNIASITKEAFANVNSKDFEGLISEVYAKHLSHKDLKEMASITEDPAIQKFFKIIFDKLLSGEKIDNKELIGKLSTSELTAVLKMSTNESFLQMKKALPTINKELAQKGEAWGEEVLANYLKNQ